MFARRSLLGEDHPKPGQLTVIKAPPRALSCISERYRPNQVDVSARAKPAQTPRRWSVRTAFGALWPVIIVVAAIAVVFGSGLYRELSFEVAGATPRHHREARGRHEITAFAAYVGLYIVVVMLSIPGAMVLTVAGGVLFGTLVGALGAIAGATVGGTIIFLIARGAVGEILIRRAGPTACQGRGRFSRGRLLLSAVPPLVPLFPFWLVNLVPALAGVRLRPSSPRLRSASFRAVLCVRAFRFSLDSMIYARRPPIRPASRPVTRLQARLQRVCAGNAAGLDCIHHSRPVRAHSGGGA